MANAISSSPSAMDDSAVFAYVIGAPGSGKGTLCKRLFENHNVIHLSIGDILRDVATQQPTDPEIAEHVRAGTLVPVETLSTYLKMAMVPREQHDPDCIFLIDGAPRKLSQTEHLESTIGLPAFVLFFNCPQAISRERVLNRKVQGRNDTEQIFEKRYAEFAVENPAIVAYYRGKGLLIEIDTSKDTETSFASLTAKLILKRMIPGADKAAWEWWVDDE